MCMTLKDVHKIVPSCKSHNALDKYPTVHHFVTEMCKFLLKNGALWDMEQEYYEIYETGVLIGI